MIPYSTKENERSFGVGIPNESHVIGIVGVATYASLQIQLVEVPQGPAPAVTITGSGGPYTEVTTSPSTGGQFEVNYTTGVITFAPGQNGNTVLVSYTGLGSEIAAQDVNEVQEPLNSIVQLSLTYNPPYTSASAAWTLVPGLAVTMLNGLQNSIDIVAGTNITITPVGNNIRIDATGGGGTPGGVSGNIQYNNAGAFGGAANVVTNGTNLGVGTSTPNASAVLDVESTTQGFLPPQMTSTQRNAIVSPANGLIVYDTTLNQLWEYQNGSWAAIGVYSAGTGLTLTGTTFSLTTPVSVVNGGTGVSSWTNGQLLIGNTTGNTAALATLTGTANEIIVTNGASSITLSTPQAIATTSSPTFAGLTLTTPLSVANGGTGTTGFTSNTVITGNSGLSSLTTTPNSFFIAFGGTLEWLPFGTAPSFAGWSSTAVPAALTLLGTTNEIIVTAAGTNVTLSTPQAIATSSSPSFASMSLTNTSGVVLNVAGTAGSTTILCTGDIEGNNIIANGFIDVQSGNAVNFSGSSSGTVSLQAPATVTGYTIKLPSAVATSTGQALTSDTSGNTSWSTIGTVSGGSATQLAVYATTGSTVSGATYLTYSDPSLTLTTTGLSSPSFNIEAASSAPSNLSMSGTGYNFGIQAAGSTWTLGDSTHSINFLQYQYNAGNPYLTVAVELNLTHGIEGATSITAQTIALSNALYLPALSSRPSGSLVAGTVYFATNIASGTSTGSIQVYDGTSWHTVTNS